jgi:Mrp family chromosome partitioning ATPase/capsular polysaccharide biosynthesis protein
MTGAADGGTSITDIAGVLRRRAWLLLLCLIAFPAAAYGISQLQEPVYRAEAQVLLSDQNLANSLTDTPDPGSRIDRDRIARTQIEIAKLPAIADLTLRRLKIKDMTPEQLLADVEISSLGKTDIMAVNVTGGDAEQVVALANEYARQYTLYRARLDTAAINRTLREVKSRLDALGGDKESELYEDLTDKSQRLRTLQTLQTSNSILIRRATEAEQIEPTPWRDAGLGLVLGLIFGGALILVVDALDSRLRGGEAIAAALGGPLLGRIPPLGRRRDKFSIAMLEQPRGEVAEAYRRALSGVEFSLALEPARTIAVISATDAEGRSDLVANMAVGFARSGRRVAAVDTDFTNPRLSALLRVHGIAGLSDLAIGRFDRARVCLPIDVEAEGSPWHGDAATDAAGAFNTNGHTSAAGGASGDFGQSGGLEAVSTGSVPPEPGDFLGTDAVGRAIESIAQGCEIVLIDTPGMLRASDAQRVSRHVDAVVIVAGADALRRDTARALRRQLDQMSSRLLGVVVTDDPMAQELASLGRQPGGRRRAEASVPPVTPAAS